MIRLNSKGPQFSLSKSPQRPRFTLELAFALALPFAFALASGCINLEPPFAIPWHKSQVLFWISEFAPFETIKFDDHKLLCPLLFFAVANGQSLSEKNQMMMLAVWVYLGLNWGLLVGVPTSLIKQPFPMSNLLEGFPSNPLNNADQTSRVCSMSSIGGFRIWCSLISLLSCHCA